MYMWRDSHWVLWQKRWAHIIPIWTAQGAHHAMELPIHWWFLLYPSKIMSKMVIWGREGMLRMSETHLKHCLYRDWHHHPAIQSSGREVILPKGIHKWVYYVVHHFASTRWWTCCRICSQVLGASESDHHLVQHSTANIAHLTFHSNTYRCWDKYIILLLCIWH